MISAQAAWQLLGLAPGSDVRAVKRAYAARLKAIDPDRDIEGFTRLREARAIAMRTAARVTDDAAGPDSAPSITANPVDNPVIPAPPRRRVETAPPTDRVLARDVPDARAVFVQALQAFANQAISQADLCAAFGRLVDDPRLDAVDFQDEFELWLGRTLLQTLPASDPVIPLAVAHFGWDAELDKARPRPLPLRVAQRAEDSRCMMALGEPDHIWHEAFRILREPQAGTVPRLTYVRLRPKVRDLISSIRHHNPAVEHVLDQDAVTAWSTSRYRVPDRLLLHSDGISWYGWLVIGWLLLNLGRLAMAGLRL